MTDGYTAQYSTADATEAGTDIVVGSFVQVANLIGVIVLIIIGGFILNKLSHLGKFGSK